MNDNEGIVEMVKCQDCGHVVPASNLTIHQLRGCREARRRPADSERFNTRTETENVASMDIESDAEDDRKMEGEARAEQSSTSGPFNRAEISVPTAASVSVAGRNSADPIPVPESTPPRNQRGDYVDLMDADDDEVQEIWPCPGCTFHNSLSSRICEVCSAMRPLSHNMHERRDRGNADSPIRLMSGGALLGSLVGGAAAYMRGRPMSSGMIQGALSGAVGGAFANELFRNENLESPDSNPSFVRTVRTVRRDGPNGTSVTTYMSHGAPAARRRNPGGNLTVDELLQMLLAGNGARQMNIDGMNYEQLLERFGDGTENRGADESDIHSLPVSVVANESSLPNDYSDCMVCLESFKAGDERKTLPCLHGFHSACVDKWLRTSASCPVCKHSVRSES